MERELLLSGRRMQIWALRAASHDVQEFLRGLEQTEHGKVFRLVQWVAENGLPRNPEKYKCLHGYPSGAEIHELKAHPVRLLFFIWGTQDIVLTNGFAKRTDRTPRTEIERAETRRAAFLTTENRDGWPKLVRD